jgi:MFS family permease
MSAPQPPWYRELNRYHIWVFVVASLGWLFDTMDQRLFTLSRERALQDLLGAAATPGDVKFYGGVATAIFLVGWAKGGLIFGILGDRWGRARTMLLTILIYSIFTGLSALSQTWWDFTIYRFLTGLGVGGEFAAGVALVAEVMPPRARPYFLGLLQALSAVGNIAGSFLGYVLLPETFTWSASAPGEEPVLIGGWRLLFLAGVVPALLVVAVRRRLKEPESWRAARQAALESGHKVELGSLWELLGDPRWQRRTIVGVLLTLAGVIGIWGVGFWTPELIRGHVLSHLPKGEQDRIASLAFALQDVGAFFGILAFTWFAARMGRRAAFLVGFLAALGMTVLVFGTMDTQSQIYWMVPLLGFSNLMVFGGYAIYFPELFPTRLRSTGTGFCYNVARYLAAIGPFTLGGLSHLYEGAGFEEPFRLAAVTVASTYLIGIAVLPWAPETRGKPLPE